METTLPSHEDTFSSEMIITKTPCMKFSRKFYLNLMPTTNVFYAHIRNLFLECVFEIENKFLELKNFLTANNVDIVYVNEKQNLIAHINEFFPDTKFFVRIALQIATWSHS